MCCIFSLHAVAAASDGNSTDPVVLTADNNVSAYSLPSTDIQLVGSANAETFSALNTKLSQGGEVTLEKNYTYDDSSDSSFRNGISVPNTVTKIDGQGKVIIDGNKMARIFNIHADHAITITGITFINANNANDNDDANGGSINSDGTLIISNCNFINNTAAGNGGAVYLGSSAGDTITDCTFEGNVAGGNGGAIEWYTGSLNGEIIGSLSTTILLNVVVVLYIGVVTTAL